MGQKSEMSTYFITLLYVLFCYFYVQVDRRCFINFFSDQRLGISSSLRSGLSINMGQEMFLHILLHYYTCYLHILCSNSVGVWIELHIKSLITIAHQQNWIVGHPVSMVDICQHSSTLKTNSIDTGGVIFIFGCCCGFALK